jgi:hypothetical protein
MFSYGRPNAIEFKYINAIEFRIYFALTFLVSLCPGEQNAKVQYMLKVTTVTDY